MKNENYGLLDISASSMQVLSIYKIVDIIMVLVVVGCEERFIYVPEVAEVVIILSIKYLSNKVTTRRNRETEDKS